MKDDNIQPDNSVEIGLNHYKLECLYNSDKYSIANYAFGVYNTIQNEYLFPIMRMLVVVVMKVGMVVAVMEVIAEHPESQSRKKTKTSSLKSLVMKYSRAMLVNGKV